MSIRPKGKKWQYDFMYAGKRYRKSFTDKKDAQAEELDFKRHLEAGWSIDKFTKTSEQKQKLKSEINLQEMFDLVLDTHWKGKANYDNAFSHSKMICEYFGSKMKVKDIDLVELNALNLHLKQAGNSDATRKLKFATLSTAMTEVLKAGYIQSKPTFPKIKVDNERYVFFSREEEAEILEFLEASGEDYFYDFFCWQMDTGCRPGESRSIRPEHVRTDDNLGLVVDLYAENTKSKVNRTIPLTRRAIVSYKNQAHRDKLWDYWTKERIRTVWDKVRKHMGRTRDKDFVFYLTRHTCGSRIVEATGSIYLVKEMLGHKSLEQSMRYAKLSPSNLRQALCALDRSLELSDKTVTNVSQFRDNLKSKKENNKIA